MRGRRIESEIRCVIAEFVLINGLRLLSLMFCVYSATRPDPVFRVFVCVFGFRFDFFASHLTLSLCVCVSEMNHQ